MKKKRELKEITDRQVWNLYKLMYGDGFGYWVTRAWQGNDNGAYSGFRAELRCGNVFLPHPVEPSKLLILHNWLKKHNFNIGEE